MNLKTTYLGLDLDNPIIIGSSPFTMDLSRIEKMHNAGAGAVVLKSVFEEQVASEASFLQRYNDFSSAADYLKNYLEQGYLDSHLKLIEGTKRAVPIPVIASINCAMSDTWLDYARSIEQAGADALELNIFILPTDSEQKGEEIEKRYLAIAESVTAKLRIPVSVKLGIRFTNVLNICRELYYRRVKGVVMFNRFFEPDVNVDNMELVASDSLSERSELRNNLRTIGLCSPQLPKLDISVSSGVHKGEDVVKSLLMGARAVQICTALYRSGEGVIGEMNGFLGEWMERRGFSSIDEVRGLMSHKRLADEEVYERVQYMKFMPKK